MPHPPDTDTHVYFYGPEFYVLSNFSAFNLSWKGLVFPTSEHAYQWSKFFDQGIKDKILAAPSAHEAYRISQCHILDVRSDWSREVRLKTMKYILRAKVDQHEYVRRKLLETDKRILVEDSWRDSVWGWGPDQKGQNLLGRLWMEVREDLEIEQFHQQLQRDLDQAREVADN